MKRKKSGRKTITHSTSLLEAVDDCYEDQTAERLYIKPEQFLLSVQLACMWTLGFIDRPLDAKFFFAVIRSLERLQRQFRDGEIKHLEDGVGMSRPARWSQRAALRRSRYKHKTIGEVVRRRNEGEKTSDVYRNIYDSGMFPEDVSASTIQKWWYEHDKKERAAIARSIIPNKKISK